jgi:small-conductance mechanosensitive channel
LKALKIFSFLISFFVCQPIIAEDINIISKKISELNQQAYNHQNSQRILFQILTQLKPYQPQFEKCIYHEKSTLDKLKQEMALLDDINDAFIKEQRNQHQLKIEKHYARYEICQFSLLQINNTLKDIENWNQKIYKQSYKIRYESFMSLISKNNFFEMPSPPVGYVYQIFIEKSSFIRNFKAIIICLFVICIFKLGYWIKKISFIGIHRVSISRFLFISSIFLFIAPVQYILLKTGYIHCEEILLQFFDRPLSYVLTLMFIYYMYNYYYYQSVVREVFIIFTTLFLQALLIRFCFSLNYYDLNNISLSETLLMKYTILITQEVLIFFVCFWLIFKILHLKFYPKQIFLIVQLLLLINFIIGLNGYVDMAVNNNFSIVIAGVLIVWIILLNRIKDIVIKKIQEPSKNFAVNMQNIFGSYTEKVFFNIKGLVYFIYSVTLFQMMVSISVIILWFLPQSISSFVTSMMFNTHHIEKFSFTPIRYLYAFFMFYNLNILNYGLSNYLAKRFFVNPISSQKTSQLFYWIGFVFTCLIILMIAGFEFQNFVIILGGLSFGLGLGLRNTLNNILSSFFLLINRPYDIGDYIEINQVSGYVKKMTLMETVIETLDKNSMILPNEYVASSVIQNFTYNQKEFHKVHFKYRLLKFNLSQEEQVKNMMTTYLTTKENVSINRDHPIKYIFYPTSEVKDAFGLELIFSLKSLKNINESTSEISCELLELLKEQGFDVQFDEVWHPMKGSGFMSKTKKDFE